MTGLRLLAGMAVAYAILALIARAQADMAEGRTTGAQVTALVVMLAAPAFATSLLLGPAGFTMAGVRIAAFAALGVTIIFMSVRIPEEARDMRRLFLVLAAGALALTGLRLG
ncbi:MAG: hypothetical protein AAFS07_00650 [Pseudomonadota bacterium]